MSAISAVQSAGNVYSNTTTKPRQSTGDLAPSGGASSVVSISDAAREVARDGYLKMPDYVAGWFNKDFPQDVIDEAQARHDDIKANGWLGGGGPTMLPLLPENQKLLDGFKQEMKDIRAAGFENAPPAQSERFNLLLNLSIRVHLVGWEKPVTEADVQREFDISIAMGKISHNDPIPAPSADSAKSAAQIRAEIESKAVPSNWRQRWQDEGLTMPENVTLSRDRSMWLDVAKAAGIGEDEFLAKLREQAGSLKGSALTHAIESFISERYVALAELPKIFT